MKTVKTFLTISLMSLSILAISQDYAFKVMAKMGKNEVKQGADWVSIKTGASLKSSDQVRVSDGAYLGLIHAKGKSLEVRKAGTYKVSDLEAKVPAGKSTATRYANYLSQQMTPEAKKDRLSATGAVHRGGSGDINLYIPNSANIFMETTVIKWDPIEGDNITYKVVVKNLFGDILVSEETTETSFALDLTQDGFKEWPSFMVKVMTAEDEDINSGDDKVITKLRSEKKETISVELSELMSDANEESALNKYILAGFYEENGLILDALTSFEQAIKLAPEVETYQEAYEEFLLRKALKKVNN